jgi:hypothetical protein
MHSPISLVLIGMPPNGFGSVMLALPSKSVNAMLVLLSKNVNELRVLHGRSANGLHVSPRRNVNVTHVSPRRNVKPPGDFAIRTRALPSKSVNAMLGSLSKNVSAMPALHGKSVNGLRVSACGSADPCETPVTLDRSIS